MSTRAFAWRGGGVLATLCLAAGCVTQPDRSAGPEAFGVLVMAHGGGRASS